MAPISIADAPPSSPEFVIKKPHDESNRTKQWRARNHSARLPKITMPALPDALPSGGSKRIVRTYSKKDAAVSSRSSRGAREPPMKRPRTENLCSTSTEQRAPVPPPTAPPTVPRTAASRSPPMGMSAGAVKQVGEGKKKARKTTIDAYFACVPNRSSSPASTRGAGICSSSDREDSGSDGVVSPSSSPPPVSRRWTSPRRLRARASLAPIAGDAIADGAEGEAEGPSKMGDKSRRHTLGSFLETEAGDGGTMKTAAHPTRGQQRDEHPVKPAVLSPAAACEDSGVRSRSVEIPDSEEEESVTPSPPSIKHHTPTSGPREQYPDASRAYVSPPVSNPITREDSPTTSLSHSNASVPVYNMPYAFYVAAAAKPPTPPQSHASSLSPATSPMSKTSGPAGKKGAQKSSGSVGKKVQTTLNLSTKQAFKECRLCDTVYNPLHPADVKLHQARHARILSGGGGSGEGMGRRKTVS